MFFFLAFFYQFCLKKIAMFQSTMNMLWTFFIFILWIIRGRGLYLVLLELTMLILVQLSRISKFNTLSHLHVNTLKVKLFYQVSPMIVQRTGLSTLVQLVGRFFPMKQQTYCQIIFLFLQDSIVEYMKLKRKAKHQSSAI